jgi:hypothetical protein
MEQAASAGRLVSIPVAGSARVATPRCSGDGLVHQAEGRPGNVVRCDEVDAGADTALCDFHALYEGLRGLATAGGKVWSLGALLIDPRSIEPRQFFEPASKRAGPDRCHIGQSLHAELDSRCQRFTFVWRHSFDLGGWQRIGPNPGDLARFRLR